MLAGPQQHSYHPQLMYSHHYNYDHTSFQPTHPSPLSPRRDSLQNQQQTPRSYTFMSETPKPIFSTNDENTPYHHTPQPSSTTIHNSHFSPTFSGGPRPHSTLRTPTRPHRPEPSSLTSQTSLSARRRALFQTRVRNARNDAQWARRGEELERLDWRNERARWERGREDEGRGWSGDGALEDGVEEEGGMGEATEEADDVVRWEEAEMDALVDGFMDDEPASRAGADKHNWAYPAQNGREGHMDGIMDERDDASSGFGSDDEVYDSIFSEIMLNNQPPNKQIPHERERQDEEMDLS